MKTYVTSPGPALQFDLTQRLLAALVALLLASPFAAAQGSNDPIGDLPKNVGGNSQGQDATQGNGAGEDPIDAETVTENLEQFVEAGSLDAGELTRSATAEIANGQALLQATPTPAFPLMATVDPGTWPHIRLLPPEDAVWMQAVLLIDTGTADLAALMTGQAPIDTLIPAGLPYAFDADKFAELSAEQLPVGTHATWVMLSIDSAGVLHHAAVRCGADGEPLEVFID